MKIIIIGAGKVGITLASQLSSEGHEITVIDKDSEAVNRAVSAADVQGIAGNGTSHEIQESAGIADADLMLAVTDNDESSLLSCLMAKKTGNNCKTIARVRNPEYYKDIAFIKEELGLAMAINPEIEAANYIYRLIQIPSALEVESFAKNRITLIHLQIPDGSVLNGLKIKNLSQTIHQTLLICGIEHKGRVFIPNGETVLNSGDKISIIAPLYDVRRVMDKIGIKTKPIKSVTIAGGGNISYYLAAALIKYKIRVKIFELNKARCEELSTLLPEAVIINGDASDKNLLFEEGITDTDAFVALTGIDEENIMLSLFTQKVSEAKLITKISKITFEEVVNELPLGSIVYPKEITARLIAGYIRALSNSRGSNVETLYKLMDGRIEALEFKVSEAALEDGLVGVPLMDLRLKPGLLICAIARGKKIITPGGKDIFKVGDSVIVATTILGLNDLRDILL